MTILRNLCACRQTGQVKISILKICGCIPVVKIFTFFGLVKNFSFPDSLLVLNLVA